MPVHMVMPVCMVRQLLEVVNNIIGSIPIGATYGLSVFLRPSPASYSVVSQQLRHLSYGSHGGI